MPFAALTSLFGSLEYVTVTAIFFPFRLSGGPPHRDLIAWPPPGCNGMRLALGQETRSQVTGRVI